MFKTTFILLSLLTLAAHADTPSPRNVGILVGGSVIDPRARTWSLSSGSDSITIGGTPTFNLGTLNGAATSAKQDALLTALGSPFQAGGSVGLSGTLPAFAATPTFNVGALNGAATSAKQDTLLTALGSPFQAGGSVGLSGTLPAFAATPTFNVGTLNGIATEATLAAMSAKLPAQGQAAAAASQPVTLSNENVQDFYVAGQPAQTAVVNNILPAASGAAALDLTGYRSCTVQVVSTGTAGTFIFEGANDNASFQTIPVFNQLILTGTPITAAITASATQIIYTFPVPARYIRLRIATTITGGSIQTFTKCGQTSFTPAILQVAQATAASLATSATIASGTVTTVSTVTSDNIAIPSTIADVASAALTTTTTTAAFTPTNGVSYTISVPVTVVSGTTPTLDLEVQESVDSGTNWQVVYDFPRITATGFYRSPLLQFTGNRVRYVQTVSGTTPSFTRAISRFQNSTSLPVPVRQIIDRTINLTSLNSVTATLPLDSNTKNLMVTISIGAATTPPSVQLQCSDDAGATYYKIGSPLAALASSTLSATVANVTCQMAQAIVTTAGTVVTSNYVVVKGF